MKPVKKKHDCTAEIIAELERLVTDWVENPDYKGVGIRIYVADRIKELKGEAKETQL